MSAANDERIDQPQDQYVALHARYLLALKGHRRGAFILGFFYGAMSVGIVFYLAPRVIALLAKI